MIALLCAGSFSTMALANDGVDDKTKGMMLSLSCASCHGTDGKSKTITPYIAGMAKGYLYKTLLDYKYGKRDGTMMPKHVKGFSDKELELVADYFSKVARDK
jgi:sulfide dehydrogenase cytochrome subunit